MTIEFLQSASKICFGIAIASAILAAALFFLLDIWENFLIETDRAQRKTIDEMHERNRATGKLRADDEKRGNTGKVSTKSVTGAGKTLKSTDPAKKDGIPPLGADKGPQSDEVLLQSSAPAAKYTESSRSAMSGSQETRALADVINKPVSGFRIVQKTIITHTQESIPL